MSGWGARKSVRVGPFRFTLSASGVNASVGGRRGRVGVNSKGRKRASVNLGRGVSWRRSRG